MQVNWTISFVSRFKGCRLHISKILTVLTFLHSIANAESSNASTSDECLYAARFASHETGVPYSVLLAITHVETGRKVDGQIAPWPWAINHVGKGGWLASEAELLESALALIARGERSFDLGCFQLNYRWHGAEFDSLDQMISPRENALYAARFLKSLFGEMGDWTEAAGAYHSRTEKHANAYKAKFLVHYDEDTQPLQLAMRSQPVVERQNSYPLLISGASSASLGSLVPSASR